MATLANEIKVIDTDTHIIEPYDLWTSRMSTRKWGDKVPHVKWDEASQQDAWFFGNTRVSSAGFAASAGWHEYFPSVPKRLSEAQTYTWQVEGRLKIMDEYGIYAQILYPNVAGFGAGKYLALEDRELMLACLRTYNDWLTEWASADPKRFIPQMAVPFWDMEACLPEMERCAKLGHKGVLMTADPERFSLPKLTDPKWDSFWAAAQDMQLPVNFHIGTGDTAHIMGHMHESVGKHAAAASLGALVELENAKVITQLIFGGVCHRFPRVNFVSVESGVGWLPFLVDALDYQWLSCGAFKEHPDYLMPSETFRRQIYGCFWFERDTLRFAIDKLGADNILYESDFPHPTSMSPGPASPALAPKDYIDEALAGVSRSDAEKILHGNAARIYHLS